MNRFTRPLDLQYRLATGAVLRADEPDDDGLGLIRFTASTEARASDHGIIDHDGWDLSTYQRNPLVLWSHNGPGLCGGRGGAPLHPIGKGVSPELQLDAPKGERSLVIPVQFNEEIDARTKSPINPLAYLTAFQVRAGYLSMVSVGFRVLERMDARDHGEGHPFYDDENDQAWTAVRASLHELSVVGMGADPGAFAEGRGAMGSLEEAARNFLETDVGRSILDARIRDAVAFEMERREKAAAEAAAEAQAASFFGFKS